MENQISNLVFDILHNNSGHLYVCGDVTMAREVAEALKRVYVKVGKMTMEEAEAMIQNMKVTERPCGHNQCV